MQKGEINFEEIENKLDYGLKWGNGNELNKFFNGTPRKKLGIIFDSFSEEKVF